MSCDEETKQALKECFDLIDSDKSGYLDVKELRKVLLEFNQSSHCHKQLSDEEINNSVKEFIEVVDSNADNKISKDEFLNFFVQLCQ